MGVIYKIKPEVIEFIINQKKKSPGISCRGLVSVVKKDFSVSLSKSSVNQIIKDAKLSSHVGRRRKRPTRISQVTGLDVRDEKGTAFDAEKTVLIKSRIGKLLEAIGKADMPKPVIPPEEKPKPSKPEEPKPDEIIKPKGREEEPLRIQDLKTKTLKPEIPTPEDKIVEPAKTKEPEIAKEPESQLTEHPLDAPAIKEQEIKKISYQPSEETPYLPTTYAPEPESLEQPQIGELKYSFRLIGADPQKRINFAGAFFLKASELEASSGSILLKIWSDILTDELKDLYFVMDSLFYSRLLGASEAGGSLDYADDGLCALSEYKKPSKELFYKYLEILAGTKRRSLSLHANASQYFRQVSYLKITLLDTTVFYLDARLKSPWSKPCNFEYLESSYRSLENNLKDSFLACSRPIILLGDSGYNVFSEPMKEFILSCESAAVKDITKIELFNSQGDLVGVFDEVPNKNRYFIFGFWPWQREFSDLTKRKASQGESFVMEDTGVRIYCSESSMEFLPKPGSKKIMLRIISLKDSSFSAVWSGIVTNIGSANLTAKDIAEIYMNRWGRPEAIAKELFSDIQTKRPPEKEQAHTKRKEDEDTYGIAGGSNESLQDDFDFAISKLNDYAISAFFKPDYKKADFYTMRENFYKLPGNISRTADKLIINIHTPAGYNFYEDLLYAANRVNESFIFEGQRRLILNVTKETLA